MLPKMLLNSKPIGYGGCARYRFSIAVGLNGSVGLDIDNCERDDRQKGISVLPLVVY